MYCIKLSLNSFAYNYLIYYSKYNLVYQLILLFAFSILLLYLREYYWKL